MRRIGLALVLGVAAGCGPSPASLDAHYPHGAATAKLAPAAQTALRTALEASFGIPGQPRLYVGGAHAVPEAELLAGRDFFRNHCLHCHGFYGRGDGPTAEWLEPRPRNFWKGQFKFRSTTASKPTRDDLERIITTGAHGTAMPSFALFPTEDVKRVAGYVWHLAVRGEVEQKAAADVAEGTDPATAVGEWVETIGGWWRKADQGVVRPSAARPPPGDAASIERGRALFRDAGRGNCVACHGANADGAATAEQKASWLATFEKGEGFESVASPADLNRGMYRGGTRALDLFWRISTGVTPMPSFADSLKEEERWDLVNYVRAIPYLGTDGKP